MDKSPVRSLRASCSHCRASLKCPAKYVDRAIRCPKCGKSFKVTRPRRTKSKVAPATRNDVSPITFAPALDQSNVAEPPVIKTDANRRHLRRTAKPTSRQVFVIGLIYLVGVLLGLVLVDQLTQPSSSNANGNILILLIKIFLGCALLVGIIAFYFIPYLVARSRKHRNVTPILIVNFFFGWSFLGWVFCLAWSYWSDVPASRQYVKDP